MKIGIVAPSGATNNGIGIYADQMANSFNAFAQVVRVCVLSGADDVDNPIALQVRKNSAGDYERAAHELNESCDVCILHHAFGAYGWKNGGLALVFAKALRIPLFVVFHEVNHTVADGKRRMAQALGALASLSVVMSTQAANVVEHLFKIPAEKIKVLPYGVGSFSKIDRAEAKALCGFGQHSVVMSFGLLKPSNNLEKVLEAIAILINKMPHLLFVHVGLTNQADGQRSGEAYRQKLLLLARHLKIEKNVVFINRHVTDRRLFEYLQSADLVVLGNTDESTLQSATLPMAMSAGAAILTSPFLYANELLGDKLGEITPFDDAQLLASKIQGLLLHPKQLQVYRQAAGDYGIQFAWDKISQRYLLLLSEILANCSVTLSDNWLTDLQLLVPMEKLANAVNARHGDIAGDVVVWQMVAESTSCPSFNCSTALSGKSTVSLFLSQNSAAKEPSAITYFALGQWLSQNGGDGLWSAAQTLFLTLTKKITSIKSDDAKELSLFVLGLCRYLDVASDEVLLLPQLRKWHKQLLRWFTSNNNQMSHWPENRFTAYPALKVMALHSSSIVLGLNDDVEFATDKALFVIDKLFDEGCLMTLTGREFPLAKVKRVEYVQNAEEVFWSQMLCTQIASATDEVLYWEYAWRAYLWFLGENNVRKSVFNHQSFCSANQIVGTGIDANCDDLGTCIFVATLGNSHEVLVQKIAAKIR